MVRNSNNANDCTFWVLYDVIRKHYHDSDLQIDSAQTAN
jgi:hypothetical protein